MCDQKMPTWLSITFKLLLTIGAVAVLAGMIMVVKEFGSRIGKKYCMIILYVSIALTVLLNIFQAWAYPSVPD